MIRSHFVTLVKKHYFIHFCIVGLFKNNCLFKKCIYLFGLFPTHFSLFMKGLNCIYDTCLRTNCTFKAQLKSQVMSV